MIIIIIYIFFFFGGGNFYPSNTLGRTLTRIFHGLLCTFIDHRNDVKIFKTQVEPLIASEWFHCKVFVEHFDVISMVDKSKDHGNMDSFFLASVSVEVSWKIARIRKRKTNCSTITSFPWSDYYRP